MFKKLLNLIFLSFKGYSLLRSYQLNECKNIKLRGYSIEFELIKKKIFIIILKEIQSLFFQIFITQEIKSYIKLDLTKKLKIKKYVSKRDTYECIGTPAKFK